MATTTIKAGAQKQDCGTVVYANASANSRVTNSPDLSEMAGNKTVTKVPGPETDATIAAGTDSAGTYKPVAGDFAKTRAQQYVVQGATSHIAGQSYANGVFTSADKGQGRYPKPVENVRTIHITDWSYKTGAATVSGLTTDDFGNDNSARPTRSVPGELVVMETGAIPTQKDYAEKTG